MQERPHRVHNCVGQMETSKIKPSRDEVFQTKNKGEYNLYNRKPQPEWQSSTK